MPAGSINDVFKDQTAHKTFLLNVLDLELFQPTCIKYFRAGHSLSNIDNAALAHWFKKIFPLLAVTPPLPVSGTYKGEKMNLNKYHLKINRNVGLNYHVQVSAATTQATGATRLSEDKTHYSVPYMVNDFMNTSSEVHTANGFSH